MLATVDQALDRFDALLRIQNKRQDLVLRRSQAIINQLDRAGFAVIVGHLFGSYQRDTAIRPLSAVDVDLLIVLDPDRHKRWRNPEGALCAAHVIAEKLASTYRGARVGSHGVVLPFDEFKVHVAPGFAWHTGGYQIPNRTLNHWIFANPDDFADRLTSLDEREGGRILPIIRMVKAWNREIGSVFQPLHLETMVYRHFTNSTRPAGFMETGPELLAEFFAVMPDYVSRHVTEPNFEQRVDTYLDEKRTSIKRDVAVEHACMAAELAVAAQHQLRAEGERLAIATWRQLFGRAFPA